MAQDMDEQQRMQPSNIGEINLTLRYMQKALDVQGTLMKEVSAKVDVINSNTVPMSTFLAFQAHAEKIFATKEEVKPLVTIMQLMGGLTATAIVGAVFKLIFIR